MTYWFCLQWGRVLRKHIVSSLLFKSKCQSRSTVCCSCILSCAEHIHVRMCVNAHMLEFTYGIHRFLLPTRFVQHAVYVPLLYMCEFKRVCVCAHLLWAVRATWGFQIGFLLLGGGLCRHWGFWFGVHSRTAMHDRLLPFTAEKERGKEVCVGGGTNWRWADEESERQTERREVDKTQRVLENRGGRKTYGPNMPDERDWDRVMDRKNKVSALDLVWRRRGNGYFQHSKLEGGVWNVITFTT